jgi:site-specific recombinase XerD
VPNDISLSNAIEAFLASPAASSGMRSDLSRFAMLCGKECPMFTLTTSEVRECVLEVKRAPDRRKRVDALEKFFEFAKENGWVRSNVALGIVERKEPKNKPKAAVPKREAIHISPESREQIEAEIEVLLAEKERVISQVKEAREEGDLSENAGYHDARERLGLIEAQLRDRKDIISRAIDME